MSRRTAFPFSEELTLLARSCSTIAPGTVRRTLLLVIASGATPALPAIAQHTYTGAAGDNLWCTPGNWNPASVPAGAATIPGSITQRVRMASNCTPTFQSLTAIGPVDFNGDVRYSGAVIAADIIMRSGSFTIGPTVAGGATLSLTDSAEWASGILARQAIIVEGGALLRITPTAGHNLLRASLLNEGSVTQSAAVSVIGDLTQGIINDGTWTLASPGLLIRPVSISDSAEFSTNGVLTTNFDGASSAFISLRVMNTGEIRAAVGDLELAQSSHRGGQSRLNASPGRRISLAGRTSIADGLQASGDGTVAATIDLLSIDDGEFLTALDVSGTFGGGFVLNTTQGLRLGIGATLRNAGTFMWQRGPIVADSSLTTPIVNLGRFFVRAANGTLDNASIENHGQMIIDLTGSQVSLYHAAIVSPFGSSIQWRGGVLARASTTAPGISTDINLGGTLTKVTAAPGRIATPLIASIGSLIDVQEGELALDTPPGAGSHRVSGGTITVGIGALCRLGGSLMVDQADIDGQGVFRISAGGIVRVPSGGVVVASMEVSSDGLHVDNGQILGTGTVENRGTMVLSGSTLGDAGMGVPMLIRNTGFLHARDSSQLVRATIENTNIMAVDSSISLAPGGSIVNTRELSIGQAVTIVALPGTPAGRLTNAPSGTLRKRELDPSTVSASFSNVGNVLVQQGRLQIIGPIEQLVGVSQSQRELTGGSWIVQPEASLSFGNRIFSIISGSAHVVVDGTFDDFEPTRFRDQSVTELGTLLDPSEDMIASQNARITLNLGGEIGNAPGCPVGDCTRLTLQGSCELTGNGLIDRLCVLADQAMISPGSSPGTLTFRSLSMLGGLLSIELGGIAPGTQHDQVIVQNTVTLGGTLVVRMLPGFSPQSGQTFDILTAPLIVGNFGRLETHGLRSDQRAAVSILSDRVRLTIVPACPADVDDGSGLGIPDGGITIDDLLYFLLHFADGDITADLDDGTGTGTPDGGVTIDDLLYFLQRFQAGC